MGKDVVIEASVPDRHNDVTFIMSCRKSIHERQEALHQIGQAFAALVPGAGVAFPPGVPNLEIPPPALVVPGAGVRKPFEVPHGTFTEAIRDGGRHCARPGDNLRYLPCPGQRSGVDVGHAGRDQRIREAPRLFEADWRTPDRRSPCSPRGGRR
jgi:hypothetical protein